MQVTISRGVAVGRVLAPPSKSMAHRLLICAALSEGKSVIRGVSESEDMHATVDCLAALGATLVRDGDTVTVEGFLPGKALPEETLFCRESGSTLRFLIPIALLSENTVTLHGAPSLLRRPMQIYCRLCQEKKLYFEQDPSGITVRGPLAAGEYTLPGDVSSQFVSGLLFALPLCEGDSLIRLTPPVESRSYIDLTVAALSEFGVKVEWRDDVTLFVRGGQRYRAHDTTVEGDYSNAAFLDALTLLGGEVRVDGLARESLQGDRIYTEYFELLKQGAPTLEIGNCPDLGPILFAMAAVHHGATFTGTRRLRIKESDRVATMAHELEKIGARVLADEDTVTVLPTDLHAPTELFDGHNDHRIVMSTAVLCTRFGGTVQGAEAVRKSYPDFFDVLQALGIGISIE